MLVTAINVSETQQRSAICDLLRMAGLAGPWNDDGTCIFSITENENLTVLAVGGKPPVEIAKTKPLSRRVSTVEIKALWPGQPPLRFPLIDIPHSELDCRQLDQKRVVLRSAIVALAGHASGTPVLVLGFSLSKFLKRATDEYSFFGYGHLVTIIRWFLKDYACAEIIGLSPWPDGKRPLLLSFDVEGAIGRRSLGTNVLSFPFGNINLLQISRAKLVRPLVGRRCIFSVNTLNDPDGTFRSFRVTLDFRLAKRGCFALPLHATQFQCSVGIPRPRPEQKSDYADFNAWAQKHACRYTCFYSGLDASTPVMAERGFHGLAHDHYNIIPKQRIRRELADAANGFFTDNNVRAVRAPGLLWSQEFFDALGETGYGLDSSFREMNFLQPLFPIRTDAGWWELPVTDNILTQNGRLGRILAANSHYGGILSLYCHDHDLVQNDSKARYVQLVAKAEEAGHRRMGLIEFSDWLNRSRRSEILDVELDGDRTIWLTARLIPASTVIFTIHEGYTLDNLGPEWLVTTKDDNICVTYRGDEPEKTIRLPIRQALCQ